MNVVKREKKELKEIIECLTKTSGNIVNDYEKVVNRLAELEDKIENGRLVELPFVVVDKKKKRSRLLQNSTKRRLGKMFMLLRYGGICNYARRNAYSS